MTDLQTLLPDTIDLGMGVHGEPGLQQISPVPAPEKLIERMLDLVLDISDKDRAFVPFSEARDPFGDEDVVLLVNSSGSTSDEVLARFGELAVADLKSRGFEVRRLTLGPLATSLKMSGVGITVWRLPPDDGETLSRREALQLWDSPVDVVAWRG